MHPRSLSNRITELMNILDLLFCSAISPFPFRPNIVTPLIFQVFISLSFGCIFYFVYREHPGFQKSFVDFTSSYSLSFQNGNLVYYYHTFEVCSKGLLPLHVPGKARGYRGYWVELRCKTDPNTDGRVAWPFFTPFMSSCIYGKDVCF